MLAAGRQRLEGRSERLVELAEARRSRHQGGSGAKSRRFFFGGGRPGFPICNNPGMAVPAFALPQDPSSASNSDPCAAAVLLHIVQRSMAASRSELPGGPHLLRRVWLLGAHVNTGWQHSSRWALPAQRGRTWRAVCRLPSPFGFHSGQVGPRGGSS